MDETFQREPHLLTVAELAEALHTSERAVYRLAAHNEIPHYRLGSRHRGRLRFSLPEVLETLRRQADDRAGDHGSLTSAWRIR